MTFNVSLSVKRQTSEGHSPSPSFHNPCKEPTMKKVLNLETLLLSSPSLSFCNPCKETTMTTVLNLETLLLSPLFDGFEKANVSVYTDKKTVAITAATTTFSKVVDQVVIGGDDDVVTVLTDGYYEVTKEGDNLVFEKIKKEKIKKEKAKPSVPVKANRTSGCAFNPKLV